MSALPPGAFPWARPPYPPRTTEEVLSYLDYLELLVAKLAATKNPPAAPPRQEGKAKAKSRKQSRPANGRGKNRSRADKVKP
jgi:hypothetical protein